MDKGPFITTITGRPFYLLYPFESVIDIEDIAYSLARQCRFNGHVREYFSVAQHCVLVSDHVPEGLEMSGLLHDAAEAYTGDISQPLKSLLDGGFSAIEDRIEAAVAKQFDQPWPRDLRVKIQDLRSYETERRDVCALNGEYSQVTAYDPWPEKIRSWSPEYAEQEFLDRFVELGGKI